MNIAPTYSRTAERWGLLPSAGEPAWLTGAPPQGTRILILHTNEIVERQGEYWVVVGRI